MCLPQRRALIQKSSTHSVIRATTFKLSVRFAPFYSATLNWRDLPGTAFERRRERKSGGVYAAPRWSSDSLPFEWHLHAAVGLRLEFAFVFNVLFLVETIFPYRIQSLTFRQPIYYWNIARRFKQAQWV